MASRELIKNIHSSFNRLRDRAEKMAERSKENATDLLMFGRELRYAKGQLRAQRNPVLFSGICSVRRSVQMSCIHLPNFCFFPPPQLPPCSVLGSDGSSLPSWASSQSSWGALRQSLKSLSVEFAVLSDKAAQQVNLPPPPILHLLHLLCCNKQHDKNKHWCANVLRGDGKRTTSWKSSTFSWICCSRTEWVFSLSGSYSYGRNEW